jgi:hypothetical protein
MRVLVAGLTATVRRKGLEQGGAGFNEKMLADRRGE